MRRTALISASQVAERFQAVLSEHIGGELSFSVIRPVIEAALEIWCTGVPQSFDKVSIRDQLVDWGVPAQDAYQAETDLTEALLLIVQGAFKVIYPSRHYTFAWIHNGDLAVLETMRPLETLIEIEVEFENGHDAGYVPHRQRRG